jgi:PAS domain S-box-containing protein
MTSFRNTAKKAIENYKDFYEHILENVHDGVCVTNKDDVIIYVNKGKEAIAGVSKVLIIGKNVLNHFPEETIGEFRPFYLKAKQTLSPIKYVANVTTPAQRKTVQDGWLIPIVNGNEFDGMICSIQDITERKELEDKSKKESDLQNILLDNLPCLAIILKKGTREIVVSNNAARKVGASPGNHQHFLHDVLSII